jgi:hypothetical protein
MWSLSETHRLWSSSLVRPSLSVFIFYFQNWTFENKNKKLCPTIAYRVLFLFSKPSHRNMYPPVCQVNSQSDPSSQLSHHRLFCELEENTSCYFIAGRDQVNTEDCQKASNASLDECICSKLKEVEIEIH